MEETTVHCPKCGCDQVTAQKNGFSGTKAAAGAVLTGGVGLLAGLHGSNDINVSCLNCGTRWNPKKLAAERASAKETQEITELVLWKSAFYKVYESDEYEQAEEMYHQKFGEFTPTIPDVHAAYQKHKKDDRGTKIFGLVLVALFLLLLYWIFS